jgi:phosphoribosylglycinamide formyltransferase-1
MTVSILLSGRRRPLRTMVLVSATGANLRTLLDLSADRPDVLEVVLVASDGGTAPALQVARGAGIPTWPGDFAVRCGRASECRTEAELAGYRQRAQDYHDRLAARVEQFEARHGEIDLVVLAYHRWIHGRLLEKFDRRMINQHPGDLASLDPAGRRTLAGMDPVGTALRRGDRATRTSTFVVDDRHDGGAVIVRGPETPYRGPMPPSEEDVVRHEAVQKAESDRPALRWAVRALADGRVALLDDVRHADGSATVLVDGSPTSLGGWDMQPAETGRRP